MTSPPVHSLRPTDKLPFAPDPFGVRPLFYWPTPGAVHFATSVGALLDAGAPADLDDNAMAVFVRTGFFVGADTPFAAIRATPPQPSIDWLPAGPVVRSNWRHPPQTRLTRSDAIDRFADLVTDSVRRSVSEATDPLALDLTGGHDSRHLLLALDELGARPGRVVTVMPYPPESPDDLSVARLLAGALGVRHIVLPPRMDRVATEREKNALTHFCADEHGQFMPLRDYYSKHRCHVFDGLGGDVLTQSQRLDPKLHSLFVAERVDEVAEWVLGRARTVEGAVSALLTPEGSARFTRERAIGRLSAEASRHTDAPNPIASFFFFNRTRREIALAPYGVLDVTPVSTPFLDPAVVELLLSLPFDVVADRTFHTETLHRRYPTFAHVGFAGKRKGLDDRRSNRRHALALLTLVAKSRSQLVSAPHVITRTLRALATGSSAHIWFLPKVIHLLDVEQRAATVISERLPVAASRSLRAV